jgi:hypothetical protein
MFKKPAITFIGLVILLTVSACSIKEKPENRNERNFSPLPETPIVTDTDTNESMQSYMKVKVDGEEKVMIKNFKAYYSPYPSEKDPNTNYVTRISGENEYGETILMNFPGKSEKTYTTENGYLIENKNYTPALYWTVKGVNYQSNPDATDKVEINITQYNEKGVQGTFGGKVSKIGIAGYESANQLTISDGKFFVQFGDTPTGEKQIL